MCYHDNYYGGLSYSNCGLGCGYGGYGGYGGNGYWCCHPQCCGRYWSYGFY
ncbi:keratin-associated protein 20-2-like [Nannospalax galili]|uniref:keratin-associated protein 20-2-like n=1 Tax=Nannospalax galili TaxID=1026970 RepID=UPI00111BE49D|nr:keratin-associated protein 20-2-like [Nannospalax galili]